MIIHSAAFKRYKFNPSVLEDTWIMVVEEDPQTLDQLTFMLEDAGARVIAISLVSEALRILDCFSPNLLISNLRLPDGDGAFLVRHLRDGHFSSNRYIPAIAITTSLEQDQEPALLSGFQLCLVKPFQSEQLISAIANLTQ